MPLLWVPLCAALVATARGEYQEKRAIEYAKFAGAAYCSESSLKAWSCGSKCTANVTKVSVCNGDTTKAYVALWEGKCLASFQGTHDFLSALTDLKIYPQATTNWTGCEGCNVHAGFLEEYKTLGDCVKSALKTTGCPTGSSIRVTGHSLGAGIATLAMMDLADDGWVIEEAYDFGKPRTGNTAFAQKFSNVFAGKTWRVTHGLDPFVQTPVDKIIVSFGFEHTEPEVYYAGVVMEGYEVCHKPHDRAHCAGVHWNLPWDALHVMDHLDYMGVHTGSHACINADDATLIV